ncbi:protein-disulfide reductase DsbD [Aquicella lusitana]|uniref:Thiol:disulfide interchange protein DsbD n=1 Tax=Aquicella lusitana TaxID=254246 RepID=A0A370G662_9COXI|nr:protein-disulfide reductase DsbD [Aquicella lusitana]RDI38054.1 thiol:disulfide interchange protein DsbD [Aquicella lusitana]VVC72646.1 Thiol:disulfide interchange protein DsbD [Aquicella lusitana]
MIKAKLIALFLLVSACLFPMSSVASVTPLPGDEAFVFSVTVSSPEAAQVEWQIAPGYYLYAKRIRINAPDPKMIDVHMPQGEMKYDPDRGRFEAFSGLLSIPVLLHTKEKQLSLSVDYQGCSQAGFCYPPMHQTMLLNLSDLKATPIDGNKVATSASPAAASFSSLLTDQNGVQTLLESQRFFVMLLVFAGLGLLLSLTPCVWPMIPILTGIIVGQKQVMNTKRAFFLSTAYVFGMAMTYAAAGLIVAAMGGSIQVWLQQPWIIGIVSGLFVLLALSLFGLYDLRLPARWQNRLVRLSNQQKGGSYAGVFLMGALSTLIVSPCVTAPLVGVLMYIGQTGDLVLGASALFMMGIGMGMPLLLVGMSAGKWLPKSGPWMGAVKTLFGILMLGMAIWLLSRVASPTTITVFWGLLFLGIALYFGIYLPRLVGKPRLNRSLGFLAVCSSGLLMLSAFEPHLLNQWLQPNRQATFAGPSFTVVHDISDLNKQLLTAQAARRPVILDFYADWCESCVSMDRHVFASPLVSQALKNYVLLRADLTDISEENKALLKRFNVVAPPTVLFFDNSGREVNSQRIVGEVDAQEFLGRLNAFMATNCDKKVKC